MARPKACCAAVGVEHLSHQTAQTPTAILWYVIPFRSIVLETHILAQAKKLFDLGITLKKIEVISDDEVRTSLSCSIRLTPEQDEIVEAARRMVKQYDMVISSVGSTSFSFILAITHSM